MQIEISQALNDLDRELNLDNIPTEEPAIKDIKVYHLENVEIEILFLEVLFHIWNSFCNCNILQRFV